MARFEYPDPEGLSDAKRDILASTSSVLNVSRMLMHMPDPFWAAQRGLARAAVYETTIGDDLRELLILRVAYLCKADYELFHHLKIAETLGVSRDECDSMRSGDFTALPEKQRALAQFVTEVVVDVSPSDRALADVRAAFSDAQVFEVIAIIGYYMMVARAVAVSGVEIDPTPVASWPKR